MKRESHLAEAISKAIEIHMADNGTITAPDKLVKLVEAAVKGYCYPGWICKRPPLPTPRKAK